MTLHVECLSADKTCITISYRMRMVRGWSSRAHMRCRIGKLGWKERRGEDFARRPIFKRPQIGLVNMCRQSGSYDSPNPNGLFGLARGMGRQKVATENVFSSLTSGQTGRDVRRVPILLLVNREACRDARQRGAAQK